MGQAGTSGEGERLHALVRGRVQRVSFRDYASRQAQALGLVGWVRNLPGGATVEVVAEGPRRALEELLERLRQGPAAARVDDVEVRWGIAQGEVQSFRVLYR